MIEIISTDDSLPNTLNDQLFDTVMQRSIQFMLANSHERPIQEISVDDLSEKLSIPHLFFFGLVAPNPSEEVQYPVETNEDLADVSSGLE